MSKRIVGFSTGSLFKLGITPPVAASMIVDLGCNALEISFLKINSHEEINPEDFDLSSMNSLNHFCLHAPINWSNNKKDYLDAMTRFYPGVTAVIHPDTIEDFTIFDYRTIDPLFENMNNGKNTIFKSVGGMAQLLSFCPRFNVCLDVNHAYSNDPSGHLGDQFVSCFGSRIKQVHLSGYSPDWGHVPLFLTKQYELIKQAALANAPIIIESVLGNVDQLEQEYKYIIETLDVLDELEGLREKHSGARLV